MNDATSKPTLHAQLPFIALLPLLASSDLHALVNSSLGSMHTKGKVREDHASINAIVGSK